MNIFDAIELEKKMKLLLQIYGTKTLLFHKTNETLENELTRAIITFETSTLNIVFLLVFYKERIPIIIQYLRSKFLKLQLSKFLKLQLGKK